MANKQKIEILLSAQDSGLTSALKRGQASLRVFASQAKGAAAPFGSLISSALSLRTALAGIVAGVGITSLGKSLLVAGQEMDRLRLAYTAISGSGENAAKDMAFISQTAQALGLDLQTAAQAYKGIAAAAQGTSVAGKGVRDIFTAVSKASTVLGLSAEETSGALLAISQMISKGKVYAEELRGQLGERLPGAFQIAAQAMGVTTAELDKMLTNGEVFSDKFIPKFAAALEGRFANSAKAAAGSFTAATNRMSSELFTLQSALGQAVTNNTFFVQGMGVISTALKGLSGDAANNAGQWRQWAKEAALAIIDVGISGITAGNSLYRGFSGVAGVFQGAAAAATQLYAWNQKVAASLLQLASPFTDVSADVKQLKDEAAAADASAANLFSQAAANMQQMSNGSAGLNTTLATLQKFRTEMEKIKADAVNPMEGVAKKADAEFKQVAGRWVEVEKQIQQSNQETTGEAVINWGKVWNNMQKEGYDAAAEVDKALDKMARDREVTLRIKEVQAKATGGLIQRFARGGKLSGYGGGDRISALLEAGEFVIRKEAVAKFGSGIFSALNNLRLPEIPRFALGGPVGFASGGPVSAGQSMTVNLNFGGGDMIPVTTSSTADARRLVKKLEWMAQRSSR